MIRRPTRSTLSYTLFPYTTLVRSLVYEGDRRFDVTVRVPEATRVNLDDLRSLPVLLPEEAGATRRQIPLAQVAQIRLTEGLNQISRENGKRRVEIGRAHVCTQVTNAHPVCRLTLEKKKSLL